ncbi:hypothetical protein K5I29_04680 [Flavobacterium agricola]|uniref:Uncharacterized protein n=1 Tax=Flavobacterium agricola TaxID=2870839 RepID=A0ABY6M3Y9_9FLAO|nr:hypothetical protein [Flavobacterium agricola]UYW02203.1 hypothetical protein K5I29_04680 [Flavobacterium agricola]
MKKKEEAVAQAKNETQLNEENAVSVAQAFLSETKEDFEIEKIVIFYKNGTFKSFKPEK